MNNLSPFLVTNFALLEKIGLQGGTSFFRSLATLPFLVTGTKSV
jgi:hypothetical protein